jgi:hypothetical protein
MSLIDYSGTISLGENAWEPYRNRLFQIFSAWKELMYLERPRAWHDICGSETDKRDNADGIEN